jgi:hypothetical protein
MSTRLPSTRRLCGEDRYPRPLLAVAGYGLPGSNRTFPPEPLADAEWTALLAAAHDHRVTGQLQTAVDAGALPATEIQANQARCAHRAMVMRVLSLERELLALVDLLATASVEMLVLKGTAVANLDYCDPGLRSFVDLDVLVRPRDIDRAVRVLCAAGFVRTLAEPRRGFDRRFDKGVTLLSPREYGLDLHRTFVLGPWGLLVDLESLWEGCDTVIVGGRPIGTLSQVNRFMHACYHAALGDWPLRLASLRDVAEMLSWADSNVASVVRRATEWGAAAVVAAAVADTCRLLDIQVRGEMAQWAERYVPSRREVTRLALHTHENKTFAAQAFATLWMLPGLGNKAAYLRALAWPDVQYTAGRHPSALARFRFGVREVRRGRAGQR